MGKDRLERRIGIAAGNRFTCGRGTEERAARGASVRLVSHTLGRPWLPEHRRQGGGRGFDLRLPGGHRYRSHSLLLGTIATAVSLDSHFPTPSRPLRPPLLYDQARQHRGDKHATKAAQVAWQIWRPCLHAPREAALCFPRASFVTVCTF